ncbi:hypothetical protein CGGC5_v016821 [Colletotrichum fructicola Nara gc5]|uniref:Uncharacterized protein n=1 Tax=Colletotrichum fructicola (strain Nara gc5) TaxID=1213859 RepID=A0A7J6IF72_COLFN|nr:hypothetical protein CGGC5_v016821 [Colletotrichum fructicola Nara gc5]
MSAHWCPDILFIWDDGVCDSLSYVRFRPGSYFSRTNTPRPNAWIAKAIQPSSISYASPVFSTLDLLFLYSSALGELCRRLDIDAREDHEGPLRPRHAYVTWLTNDNKSIVIPPSSNLTDRVSKDMSPASSSLLLSLQPCHAVAQPRAPIFIEPVLY